MSTAVDVTVSIVNHDNREGVLACLRGLLDDALPVVSLQVIVIDNASADGSAQAVAKAFPAVELVRKPRRDGFGANHNLALALARGRHVLLLNDDTLVRPGAIDTLVAYLDGHPSVALAAPRVVDRSGATQPSAWRLPTPLRDVIGAITLGRRPKHLASGSTPHSVGWAMGCALLARRSSLLEVEGFDERYFMYSEEIDLSQRLAAIGLETHWIPQACVTHDGQVSTGGHASTARAVEMTRSRRVYWRRHYSRLGNLVAQAAVSVQFSLLALTALVRGKSGTAYLIQARGCWTDVPLPGLREQAAEWNARL